MTRGSAKSDIKKGQRKKGENSMKHRPLYDALPFLKSVDRDRQEQFEEYFNSAPLITIR